MREVYNSRRGFKATKERSLQLFEKVEGDYTRNREKFLGDTSVKKLVEKLRQGEDMKTKYNWEKLDEKVDYAEEDNKVIEVDTFKVVDLENITFTGLKWVRI